MHQRHELQQVSSTTSAQKYAWLGRHGWQGQVEHNMA